MYTLQGLWKVNNKIKIINLLYFIKETCFHQASTVTWWWRCRTRSMTSSLRCVITTSAATRSSCSFPTTGLKSSCARTAGAREGWRGASWRRGREGWGCRRWLGGRRGSGRGEGWTGKWGARWTSSPPSWKSLAVWFCLVFYLG